MLTNWIFVAFPLTVPFVLLLFPNGALPSRRWRPVAFAIVVLSALVSVGIILNPGEIDLDAPPVSRRR